jgi:hypothetical protein
MRWAVVPIYRQEVKVMSDCVNIQYGDGKPADYVMEILAMDLCSLFLPSAFVQDGQAVTGIFRREGYGSLAKLAEGRKISAEEVFRLVTGLFRGILEGEQFFIPGESYLLTPEVIYVREDFRSVRLVFWPDGRERTPETKLAALLDWLGEKSSLEGRTYAADGANFLRTNQFGRRAALHHLDTLQREIYLCGVR